MSRIGRLPIPIVSAVKVKVEGSVVSVQGPKGSITREMPGGITASIEEQTLVITRRDDSKTQKSLHGLTRSLLANAVHGVTSGFTKQLEIHGVGYTAEYDIQLYLRRSKWARSAFGDEVFHYDRVARMGGL